VVAVNYDPDNVLFNNLKKIVDSFDGLEKVEKVCGRLFNGFLLNQFGFDFIVKQPDLKSGRFVFFVEEYLLKKENDPKVFHLVSCVVQIEHLKLLKLRVLFDQLSENLFEEIKDDNKNLVLIFELDRKVFDLMTETFFLLAVSLVLKDQIV
jgi:hypothetical protein